MWGEKRFYSGFLIFGLNVPISYQNVIDQQQQFREGSGRSRFQRSETVLSLMENAF